MRGDPTSVDRLAGMCRSGGTLGHTYLENRHAVKTHGVNSKKKGASRSGVGRSVFECHTSRGTESPRKSEDEGTSRKFSNKSEGQGKGEPESRLRQGNSLDVWNAGKDLVSSTTASGEIAAHLDVFRRSSDPGTGRMGKFQRSSAARYVHNTWISAAEAANEKTIAIPTGFHWKNVDFGRKADSPQKPRSRPGEMRRR